MPLHAEERTAERTAEQRFEGSGRFDSPAAGELHEVVAQAERLGVQLQKVKITALAQNLQVD